MTRNPLDEADQATATNAIGMVAVADFRATAVCGLVAIRPRPATVAAYQRRCVAASVSSMSASETRQRAASRVDIPRSGSAPALGALGALNAGASYLLPITPRLRGSAWRQTHRVKPHNRQSWQMKV